MVHNVWTVQLVTTAPGVTRLSHGPPRSPVQLAHTTPTNEQVMNSTASHVQPASPVLTPVNLTSLTLVTKVCPLLLKPVINYLSLCLFSFTLLY